MRKLFMAAGLALSACGGDLADTASDCVHHKNPFIQIDSCTKVINSGKWGGKDLAWAYANRGIAYFNYRSGDHSSWDYSQYDHAIADFNEAIRLDPESALAYYNRGVVYNDKFEYDRAFADFQKAVRLDPKTWIYIRRLLGEYDKGNIKSAAADELKRVRAAQAELEVNIGRLRSSERPYAMAELYLG